MKESEIAMFKTSSHVTPPATDPAVSMTSTLQPEPPSEIPEKSKKGEKASVHSENHSDHGDVVRDVIIGFADGLTVPFALTAGLSSYVYHEIFRTFSKDI